MPSKRPQDKWSTKSQGLWQDLKSLQWVVVPSTLPFASFWLV